MEKGLIDTQSPSQSEYNPVLMRPTKDDLVRERDKGIVVEGKESKKPPTFSCVGNLGEAGRCRSAGWPP